MPESKDLVRDWQEQGLAPDQILDKAREIIPGRTVRVVRSRPLGGKAEQTIKVVDVLPPSDFSLFFLQPEGSTMSVIVWRTTQLFIVK